MYKKVLGYITEFIFVENKAEEADIIFVPGNGYPQMAVAAAQMWHIGYAPYILISGKYSKLIGRFETVLKKGDPYFGNYRSECEFLHEILKLQGIPEEAIIKEDQATYTYQNAIYSRRATDEAGIAVKKGILCCQPYHARRCLMYYQLLYPDTEFLVCPSDTGINRENWYCTERGIELVLGEVERCGSQFHEIIKGCCID